MDDDVGGELRIERILGGPGRSGMGTVYVGHSRLVGGVCAMKTLQDHLQHEAAVQARFRQEALTWIRLDAHDNIVQAYSWQVLDSRPVLIMKYVDGGDLGEWIGTPALIGHPDLAVRFAVDFCNGMIHAVGKGLRVHRDVKPQNCLITGGDRPVLKVTDFGLSKALDAGPALPTDVRTDRLPNVGVTRYGQAVGTCTHMAPEQFTDARGVDIRADVYAFGVMMFQMLSGRLPFEGRTWDDFRRLHATATPLRLPTDTLPELDELVMTCLAKDPRRRLPDFVAVRGRLREIYTVLTGSTSSVDSGERVMPDWQQSFKAVSLALLGRPDEALAGHDQALTKNPDGAGDHWIGRINALRSTGRHQEALACAEQAMTHLAAERSQPVLWWGLWMAKGEVLWAMERPEDALACFDRAVEFDASIDIGWSWRAGILSILKRDGEAADCYRRLVEITPDSHDAWLGLGEALRKAGHADEAVPAFDRAIALRPASMPAWANRALALAARDGQRDRQTMTQALYSVEQAIAIDRRQSDPLFTKAMLLVFYQRPDDAMTCLAEAHRLGHPSAAVMMEALNTQMRGDRAPGDAR